jgi:1,2-diacylglycerol 3-alpha-glucosyltransferase
MFVLASTFEAMGRVLLEALAHGLPVLAHDHHATRFALDRHGYRSDLTRPGNLAALIRSLGEDDLSEEKQRERHRHVYERFSWEALAPRYVDLIRRLARPAASGASSVWAEAG